MRHDRMAALRPMRVLNVALTSRCDLRCTYCYAGRPRSRDMSWETLRRSLDLLLASDAPEATLGFTGGEPLIAFGMIRRSVAYVEERLPPHRRMRYAIVTGGLRLTDEVVSFLTEHGFETRLSFDGGPVAQAERGARSFAILDRRLDRLRRDHPRFFRRNLCIACTVTPATVPHLADSVAYFLGKGVHRISMAPVIRLRPEEEDRRCGATVAAELERQIARIHEISLRHRKRTGRVPLLLLARSCEKPLWPNADRPACGVANGGRVYIDPRGEASTCPILGGDFGGAPSEHLRRAVEAMRMGPIEAEDFPQKLERFPAAARRAKIFHEKRHKSSSYGRCGECRHFADCVVCPLAAAHHPAGSDPQRVDDFGCLFNRVALDCRRRFPLQPDLMSILAAGKNVREEVTKAILG